MDDVRIDRILRYWRLRGRLDRTIKWCEDMKRPPMHLKQTVMQSTGMEGAVARTLAAIKARWREIFDGRITEEVRLAMITFEEARHRHESILEAELDAGFCALLAETAEACLNLRAMCGDGSRFSLDPVLWRKAAGLMNVVAKSDSGSVAAKSETYRSTLARRSQDANSFNAFMSDSSAHATSTAGTTFRPPNSISMPSSCASMTEASPNDPTLRSTSRSPTSEKSSDLEHD